MTDWNPILPPTFQGAQLSNCTFNINISYKGAFLFARNLIPNTPNASENSILYFFVSFGVLGIDSEHSATNINIAECINYTNVNQTCKLT